MFSNDLIKIFTQNEEEYGNVNLVYHRLSGNCETIKNESQIISVALKLMLRRNDTGSNRWNAITILAIHFAK